MTDDTIGPGTLPRGPRTWTDDIYYEVYALAAAGLSQAQVQQALGVHKDTLQGWLANKPTLRRAMEAGWRSAAAPAQVAHEYVFAFLDADLKPYWDRLNAIWENYQNQLSKDDPYTQSRAILADLSVKQRQALFLHAMASTTFSVNTALRTVAIGKKTLDNWLQHDPKFAETLKQVEWHRKNYFEDRLISLVKDGDPAAILWVNKTINADRGYGPPKVQVSGTLDVSGTVDHNHKHTHLVVDLTQLNLPPDVMDQVVAAMLKAPNVNSDGLIVETEGLYGNNAK